MNPRKVALVTGAGKRRVGAHVADALANRGYALVIHYRSSATEANEAVARYRDTVYADFSESKWSIRRRYASSAAARNCLVGIEPLVSSWPNKDNTIFRSQARFSAALP